MSSIQGITEDDIANYLLQTPGFFERQAELLGQVQLRSPHGARAVSLQERQVELLREKVRGLEQRLIEMIRHGQENVAIADRLHRWTRELMLTRDPLALPGVLVQGLQREFLIPQATLRLWGPATPPAESEWAQPVCDELRSFTTSLSLPYCGPNAGFDAAAWLADPPASLALVPLRHGSASAAFGLLVLGSPDPTRFRAEMGTEFLMRIGELASAGLVHLLPH